MELQYLVLVYRDTYFKVILRYQNVLEQINLRKQTHVKIKKSIEIDPSVKKKMPSGSMMYPNGQELASGLTPFDFPEL